MTNQFAGGNSIASTERAGPVGGEIRFENVSKRFGDTVAVEPLDLVVPDGCYCCLLGPSGCGKTTLLRMMAGHETPTTGAIKIGGQVVNTLSPQQRGTAMMFQDYGLFPHLNVLENVAFSEKMKGTPKAERLEKAQKMVERVYLDQFMTRYPAELSGGQQQRVALARALITQPRVLLLDEPLSALDEHLRLQMRGELRSMHAEFGISFVHVTHTQLEALGVADMVVVMNHGRIEQSGTPEEIYSSPRNAYVARFIGGSIVIEGTVSNAPSGGLGVTTASGEVFQLDRQAVGSNKKTGDKFAFSVRRDKLVVVDPLATDGPAGFVDVEIDMIEYQGVFAKAQGRAESIPDFVAYINDADFVKRGIRVDERVRFGWSLSDVHILQTDPA